MMSQYLSDTSPEAEQVMLTLLRQMPPWRKLEQVEQMNATVKFLILEGLHQRHPEADEQEIKRRLADILLGEELAAKAFGAWATDTEEATDG